jgi:hypothetical protein
MESANELLLGPALPTIGWQNLWLANAAAAGALAIGLRHALPARMNATPLAVPPLSGMVVVLRDRRCALMAGAFFAYSFHYFSLAFVLPLLLITTLGHSIGNAALLAAVGMGVSAVGNLISIPPHPAVCHIFAKASRPSGLLITGDNRECGGCNLKRVTQLSWLQHRWYRLD